MDSSSSGNNARKANKQFILTGLTFCIQLTLHHTTEETHIFPVLAKEMPQFRHGRNTPLLRQHRQIHEDLARLEGI